MPTALYDVAGHVEHRQFRNDGETELLKSCGKCRRQRPLGLRRDYVAIQHRASCQLHCGLSTNTSQLSFFTYRSSYSIPYLTARWRIYNHPSAAESTVLLQHAVNLILVLQLERRRRLVSAHTISVEQETKRTNVHTLARSICAEHFLHARGFLHLKVCLLPSLHEFPVSQINVHVKADVSKSSRRKARSR